jgi:hypothetical protein
MRAVTALAVMGVIAMEESAASNHIDKLMMQ